MKAYICLKCGLEFYNLQQLLKHLYLNHGYKHLENIDVEKTSEDFKEAWKDWEIP